MKRVFALTLALVLLLSLGAQAFADDILYCRMCGKKIPGDSKVCQYCGEKVVHTDTAQSEPAAAPTETRSDPSPATAAAVPGPFNSVLGSSAAPGHVRVTKSPTSESVPYGGSCMFIAHADNAASIVWYIANYDASVITTVAEASNRVAGLYVSGTNTDTLSLSGIPSWMNGCQIQACFTGEGGPVYTDIARIWTYEPAQKSKSCPPFWGWVNPCLWDDPYRWDYPCRWDYPWLPIIDGQNPPPPDVDRAITLGDGSSIAPPIKPGEYVEPAIITGHTHEVNYPDCLPTDGFSTPGPAPADLHLPDPGAGGGSPVVIEHIDHTVHP